MVFALVLLFAAPATNNNGGAKPKVDEREKRKEIRRQKLKNMEELVQPKQWIYEWDEQNPFMQLDAFQPPQTTLFQVYTPQNQVYSIHHDQRAETPDEFFTPLNHPANAQARGILEGFSGRASKNEVFNFVLLLPGYDVRGCSSFKGAIKNHLSMNSLVICVDWTAGIIDSENKNDPIDEPEFLARAYANAYHVVSLEAAKFMCYFELKYGITRDKWDFVGHSTGALLASWIARRLYIQATGGFPNKPTITTRSLFEANQARIPVTAQDRYNPNKVWRIIALDPAEINPDEIRGKQVYDTESLEEWMYYKMVLSNLPSDANFVQVIHYNSKHYSNHFLSGHSDVFVGNGELQQGDPGPRFPEGFMSHMWAMPSYAQSIALSEDKCYPVVVLCSSWKDFTEGKCTCGDNQEFCNLMGHHAYRHIQSFKHNKYFTLVAGMEGDPCLYVSVVTLKWHRLQVNQATPVQYIQLTLIHHGQNVQPSVVSLHQHSPHCKKVRNLMTCLMGLHHHLDTVLSVAVHIQPIIGFNPIPQPSEITIEQLDIKRKIIQYITIPNANL